MNIYIDGDACPKAIKDIIFKAANRTKTLCFLVANHYMQIPSSPFIKRLMVEKGFDKADDEIVNRVGEGDIVITADLPLAEDCLNKGAHVISPRGERYSLSTIKQKLALRDFNETMRSSGLHTGGPKQQSAKDVNQFANQLDTLLARS